MTALTEKEYDQLEALLRKTAPSEASYHQFMQEALLPWTEKSTPDEVKRRLRGGRV